MTIPAVSATCYAGSGGTAKKDATHGDAKNQVVCMTKPASFCKYRRLGNGQSQTMCMQSKPKSVTVKKEAIKIEPLSPKSEPKTSPQGDAKAAKPRAKRGEGEKKVTVKKEYVKPGQTRETPSEVRLVPGAYKKCTCRV